MAGSTQTALYLANNLCLSGAQSCSSRRSTSNLLVRVGVQSPGLQKAEQQFQEIMMVQCADKYMFMISHISQAYQAAYEPARKSDKRSNMAC